MELALNLIWLTIATGSFAALVRWSFGRRRNPESRQLGPVATAVVCLVALAFPIISISDDLCGNAVFVETSIKRRAPREDTDHDHTAPPTMAAVLPSPSQQFQLSWQRLAAVDDSARSLPAAMLLLGVRAPPQQAC